MIPVHTSTAPELAITTSAAAAPKLEGHHTKPVTEPPHFLPRSGIGDTTDACAINWFALRKASLAISEASIDVFNRAGSVAVNVVTVCGELRTGKSYLLNALSGSRAFGVSSAPTSFTKGVDISPNLLETTDMPDARPKVVFADMEGQGDRGMQYDVHLMTPILLVSKLIVLNVVCPTGPSKENVLNRLHVMMHASKKCSSQCDRERLFGNLHVVLRDCPHREDVCWNIIFGLEDPASAETAAEERSMSDRNEIRRAILLCFESEPKVWCLPKLAASQAPTNPADAPPSYARKITEMRAAICEQLLSPKYLDGQTVSGSVINSLLRKLAEQADGSSLSPPTLMDTIRSDEAQRIVNDALALLHGKLGELEIPAPNDVLETQVKRLRAQVMFELDVIARHLPPGSSQPLKAAVSERITQSVAEIKYRNATMLADDPLRSSTVSESGKQRGPHDTLPQEPSTPGSMDDSQLGRIFHATVVAQERQALLSPASQKLYAGVLGRSVCAQSSPRRPAEPSVGSSLHSKGFDVGGETERPKDEEVVQSSDGHLTEGGEGRSRCGDNLLCGHNLLGGKGDGERIIDMLQDAHHAWNRLLWADVEELASAYGATGIDQFSIEQNCRSQGFVRCKSSLEAILQMQKEVLCLQRLVSRLNEDLQFMDMRRDENYRAAKRAVLSSIAQNQNDMKSLSATRTNLLSWIRRVSEKKAAADARIEQKERERHKKHILIALAAAGFGALTVACAPAAAAAICAQVGVAGAAATTGAMGASSSLGLGLLGAAATAEGGIIAAVGASGFVVGGLLGTAGVAINDASQLVHGQMPESLKELRVLRQRLQDTERHLRVEIEHNGKELALLTKSGRASERSLAVLDLQGDSDRESEAERARRSQLAGDLAKAREDLRSAEEAAMKHEGGFRDPIFSGESTVEAACES